MLSYLFLFAIFALQHGHADIVSLSDADKQSAIDVHNQYRIAVGATAMQKLKWNTQLEQYAQNTASQCNFQHTDFSQRQNVAGFSYIGENIYVVAGAAMPQPTMKESIDDWATEKADYDLNSNSCSSSMCLHYTQIVWAATTDVGCATAKCDGGVTGFSSDPGYIVFCNYGIGGNIIGQKPYEQAASPADVGSKCQATFNESADSDGLCDANPSSSSNSNSNSNSNPAPSVLTTTMANTDNSNPTNCNWKCNWECGATNGNRRNKVNG